MSTAPVRGGWERHGLIWKNPTLTARARPTTRPPHDPDPLMRTLARTLSKPRPAPARRRSPPVFCETCDCLLTHPAETCPACLVWAERTANRASWKRAA